MLQNFRCIFLCNKSFATKLCPLEKENSRPPAILALVIRYELACSQTEMALYLNIDLGRLAMIEAGTREMPMPTRILKTELDIHLAIAPAGATSKSPNQLNLSDPFSLEFYMSYGFNNDEGASRKMTLIVN